MIMVSACLLGENCKYSGGNNYCGEIAAFLKDREYLAICPELAGGLKSPRPPAEIRGDRVIDREGNDVTEAFCRGAEKILALAKENQPELIILKANSPSCGVGTVYDGTFSNKKISGNGLTAALLLQNGFKVVTEEGRKGD